MTSLNLPYSNSALAAMLTLSFASACDQPAALDAGGRDGGPPPSDAWVAPTPTILSNSPVTGTADAPLNANATVTFSAPMEPSAVVAAFTMTTGTTPVAVPGTVIYAGTTATFWPAEQFTADTMYTATVAMSAVSTFAVPLAADHVFSFTTGNTRVPGLPVNLGSAGDFVLLAKSAISTVPTSAITGDVGLSPAAATFITEFSLTADATNVFSTSTQVTGRVYAANYAVPTPVNLTVAIGDMELAFTDAAGRAPDQTELGAGNIGGLTIARGVYRWGTGLLIPANITLTGSPTDVWIFQVGGDLTLDSAARVVLAGGARAENIIWQVSGRAELGTTSHCEGTILSQTSIILRTGATVNGRLLAQTAITLDSATVTQP